MSQPIGRVALDKSIVIAGSRRQEAEAAAEEGGAIPDLLCSSCGAVVCEGARRGLFAGIVLRCNGCGERNAVPPVP